MLYEFLAANHEELISLCQKKVLKRHGPGAPPIHVDRGISRFLEQLVETLRREEASAERTDKDANGESAAKEIGRAASLHGAELLRHGFTVDQVVHDYGNVCQAVTELALDRGLSLGTEEFRTLNRCLDDAIADAVTAFAHGQQQSVDRQAAGFRHRVSVFSQEHRRLTEIAIQSFAAIKTGNIGTTGATGALLTHALSELRSLIEQLRPDQDTDRTD